MMVITHYIWIAIRRSAGEGFEMRHLGFLPCASTGFTNREYKTIEFSGKDDNKQFLFNDIPI
jgi:hypothetical protein